MRGAIVLMFLGFTACTDPGQACTLEAAASTQVTVIAADGGEMPELMVAYTQSLGQTPCEDQGATWVCGYEVEGTMEIHADAMGYDAATQEVTVPSDVCHVQTQEVTLTLQPTDCLDEEVPSVEVTVTDIASEAIDGAWAQVDDPSTDGPPVPCAATADPKIFACLGYPAGTVNVLAGAPEHREERVQIEITEGDCGVETFEQSFKLHRE